MYVPPYPRSRNETATHSGDYVPPSLINDFAFCPHGSLILLVPFCQQTTIIYPYSVQKLVVIMKTVNCFKYYLGGLVASVCAMAQAGHRTGEICVGQWHWNRFIFEDYGFPLLASFHQSYLPFFILMILLAVGRTGEGREPSNKAMLVHVPESIR
jgi:hypothetical protein